MATHNNYFEFVNKYCIHFVFIKGCHFVDIFSLLIFNKIEKKYFLDFFVNLIFIITLIS